MFHVTGQACGVHHAVGVCRHMSVCLLAPLASYPLYNSPFLCTCMPGVVWSNSLRQLFPDNSICIL
jgi:hypothetical protein